MIADYSGAERTSYVFTSIKLFERGLAIMLVADSECALYYARQRVSLIAYLIQFIDVFDRAECFALEVCFLTKLGDYLAEVPLIIFRPHAVAQILAVVIYRRECLTFEFTEAGFES